MTPTQRSLKHLRDLGYRVAIVEKWNPHARIRQDLFGFIDLLAIKENETLAIQATSRGNISSRVKKIEEAEALEAVRKAGWRIVVQGWGKLKQGWCLKEVELSDGKIRTDDKEESETSLYE
jgi:hypothetical protein